MIDTLITIAYLVAASLFIFGLKRLSSPRTARGGNRMASIGMLIAIVAALFEKQILNPAELIAGLALGGAVGLLLARRTKMTSMPELVAAFNGFGGAASALVAAAEVMRYAGGEADTVFTPVLSFTIALSVLIGGVTFSGSFVAFGKLNGRVKTMGFPGLRIFSILVGLGVIGAAALMVEQAPAFPLEPSMVTAALFALAGLALVLGILLVLPIGGADMPVVVALLNSYSGLAAAATGFVLQNYALIVSGALVGASGLILTKIMCDAMNRSLFNVLLGGFGAEAKKATAKSGDEEERPIRQTSPDDAAILMSYAGSVIIVPGYGLAVAQAQHEVREMADLLQKDGVEVRYAIHPVAGRMPGHMNVLLAEANVSYDLLIEMDDINADFPSTDVVLVVGANDVVNPAAHNDEASPIYGMPILNVDEAENIIVLKRTMNTGYAGVQNELFFNPKTLMLFGDAKDSVGAIISELKQLQAA